jgi:hypothetical protein
MPWDPFAESLYAYRYVEKTITDRLGYSNTTDWGLNASGTGGSNGAFSYAASVVNGGGFKNPTRTKGGDFEARISAKPTTWLTAGVGFYSGHLGQINASNEDFPRNTATRFDAAAGVLVSGFRAGVEYFNARNYKTVNNLSASVLGTSSVVNTALIAPISDKADCISSYASYSFPGNQYSVFAIAANPKPLGHPAARHSEPRWVYQRTASADLCLSGRRRDQDRSWALLAISRLLNPPRSLRSMP